MTLVREHGQADPDSNSYITNNDAINNLPSTVIPEWNELSKDKRIDRLVIASQFIDFSFNWLGTSKTFEQGMAWPRVGLMFEGHPVPDNIVPQQIKRACYMALLLIHEHGIEIFRSTAELKVKKEKMAVFETEYFEPGLTAIYETQFADINNVLRGFYAPPSKGGVVTSQVIRA